MTFSKNQKFEKLGLFIEKSVQKHPRNSDAEIIENIRNSMPKWSQNPSKIHQKSILKSRSEKGRPKINKNRSLERPNYRIWRIFHTFWVTKNCGKSRTAQTSYFEGSIKRNACFHPSSPLIFASIFHPNFMLRLVAAGFV